MKTAMLLLSPLVALGFANPIQQAPQPPVTCTGAQKENILFSQDYNFNNSDTYEICNGQCFDFLAPYNNSISGIDPADHRTQQCTLYDLPGCVAGGAGSVTIGNARVNDLRTLTPNLDKKVSSIVCTWSD